jgi:hypothetical protein
MIAKTPEREHVLGGPLPPIPQAVRSWPWGSTPSLAKWSVEMLKYPLGTLIYDVVDGFPVLAQIQTHDTYGAHPEYGVKPHKGTSVYVPVSPDPTTGKPTAMRTPPEGWGSPDAAVSGEGGPLPGEEGMLHSHRSLRF